MTAALILIAALTLGAAAVAMTLRNLIHAALLLVGSWAGIAMFYLWAGAEFAAFAQALIYIGAVSMIVLFAVLLTRQSHEEGARAGSAGRAIAAAVVAGAMALVLGSAVMGTRLEALGDRRPTAPVRQLGRELMGGHAAALLIVGALLTVALLGAVVIASVDREDAP
jgi:NADH:ubiquinone oxidoreductase subunit 6 (subunit J)